MFWSFFGSFQAGRRGYRPRKGAGARENLPEMDGGLEQDPAYWAARTMLFWMLFRNAFTTNPRAILYTSGTKKPLVYACRKGE